MPGMPDHINPFPSDDARDFRESLRTSIAPHLRAIEESLAQIESICQDHDAEGVSDLDVRVYPVKSVAGLRRAGTVFEVSVTVAVRMGYDEVDLTFRG